jgi:hypothetical protein
MIGIIKNNRQNGWGWFSGNRLVTLIALVVTISSFSNCYTFKGFSIDPNTTSFFIKNLENKTALAQPSFAQELTEQIKNRIRSETRLSIDAENPDVEFSGHIAEYQVSAEAPNAQQGSALNRLRIVLHIEYKDNKNPKNNYKQDFVQIENFSANLTLNDVQNDLNRKLVERLINDIINKSFNNW